MRFVLGLAVLALLGAGCFDPGSGTDASPTPTASAIPPAPKVVYGPKAIDRCTPPAAQTVTEPAAGFSVETPFDELLINFHYSGVGKAKMKILPKGATTAMWESVGEDVNTLPGTTCGSHSHSGNTITKAITPGNYTITLTYSGAIAIHADVTLKASKVAANMTHDH